MCVCGAPGCFGQLGHHSVHAAAIVYCSDESLFHALWSELSHHRNKQHDSTFPSDLHWNHSYSLLYYLSISLFLSLRITHDVNTSPCMPKKHQFWYSGNKINAILCVVFDVIIINDFLKRRWKFRLWHFTLSLIWLMTWTC